MVKRIIVGLLTSVVCLTSWAGVIATWDFTGYGNGQVVVLASSYDNTFVIGPSGNPFLTATPPTGGSLKKTAGPGGATDAAMQFTTVGSGLNNGSFTLTLKAVVPLGQFSLTYNINESATTGPDTQWSWSINGGATTSQTVAHETSLGWQSETVPITGPSLTANDTITFTMTLINDLSGGGDNVSFDNFNVSAVPEPVNVALAVFGLGFVGVPVGRRIYLWARA